MPRIAYNTDLLLGQREPVQFRSPDRYRGLSNEVNLMLRGYTYHDNDTGRYWRFQIGKGITIDQYGCFVMSLYNGLISALSNPGWLSDLDLYLSSLVSGTYALSLSGLELLNEAGELNIPLALEWIFGSPEHYSIQTFSSYADFEKSSQFKYFSLTKRSINLGVGSFAIVRTTSKNSTKGVLQDQGPHAMTLLGCRKGEYVVYDPWRVNPDPESDESFRIGSTVYQPFETVKPRDKEYGIGAITVVTLKASALRAKWSMPRVRVSDVAAKLEKDAYSGVVRLMDQSLGANISELFDDVKDEASKILANMIKGSPLIQSPYFGVRIRDLAYRSVPTLSQLLPEDVAQILTRMVKYIDWVDKAVGVISALKPLLSTNPFTFIVGGILFGGAAKFTRWLLKRQAKKLVFKRLRKAYLKWSTREVVKRTVNGKTLRMTRIGGKMVYSKKGF